MLLHSVTSCNPVSFIRGLQNCPLENILAKNIFLPPVLLLLPLSWITATGFSPPGLFTNNYSRLQIYLISCCQSFPGIRRSRPPPVLIIFLRRTDRPQHILWLMAVTSYGKKIQSKVSKGKKCRGQNPGEIKHKFPQFFPTKGMQDTPNSPSKASWQHMKLSTRELLQRLTAQGFYWGLVM